MDFRRLFLGWSLAALAAAGCASQTIPSGVSSQPPLLSMHPGIGPDTATKTVRNWSTSFVYGGTTYAVRMVGTSPFSPGTTTTFTNEIIPVKLIFSDGTVLSGGAEAATLTASPIFVNASYASGNTQYGDAIMRAEFWQQTQATNFHIMLAAPTQKATVAVNVPAADGYTITGTGGSKTGYVTFAWFVSTIEPQILTQLNIDPTTLAIFLTDRTFVLESNGHCCFKGYHSAFKISTPSGPATFTTAWASVSAHDVTHMGHEVAEWMNDPFYTNVVPAWLSPGSSSCGGHKLEVGDPVAQDLFTVNGYQVEDAAFYSWFTRSVPSIGINGQYDMLSKLTGPAGVCP